MRITRALVVIAVFVAAQCAYAADFSDVRSATVTPVTNPLEIPPNIVDPAISESGD